MTKTTAADGEATEGAKRKKASATRSKTAKAATSSRAKTATKSSAAKKKAPAAKKAPAKPAAKKKAAKAKPEKAARTEQVEQLEPTGTLETIEVEIRDVDVIDDAEVIAETPLEALPAIDEGADVPEVAVELTPEEQELAALYGEDLGAPATAHAEYKDQKTADEDRPMLPEINAREERKAQWQDRRDRRRQRREERERQRQERREQHRAARPGEGRPLEARPEARPHGARPHEARPEPAYEARPPVQPPVAIDEDHDVLKRVGTPLGDAAATVFAQLRNGQPLPVRQLAAMMRKRNLVEADPEQLAPQLKAELLGDERSYRTLGLRPRIVYRGRDLFAPGPVAMSQTADAEAGFAAALSRLAGATHRALAQRIAKATPAGFERLIHAYLVAAGYRDIEWIKRVGGISYATATAPGIARTVLVSARSGDQPIDRRGIGELRVGVEAKDLVAGILFSPAELSEDAERELERAGRSIAVVCGDQLVAALISSGVGVVSAAAPLHYVDDQLLDELLAG